MKAIVAGAGIGGLTAALFLHRHGIEVDVYERAPAVQELGVGINLLPHAAGTLGELGLMEAVEATGIAPDHLYYRTRFGQTVWDEPRGRAAGLGAPQVSIHRGRLQGLLYEAFLARAGASRVHLGQRLEVVEELGDGIEARFVAADGAHESARADVVIGADGIHSTLRRLFYPDEGRPRWSGLVLWRGTADWPAFGEGRTFVIAGNNDARLVLFPIAAGERPETRLTNWVFAVRVAPDGSPLSMREDWQTEANRDDCLAALSRFSVPDLDMTALAAASQPILEFPMCDREPLPRWVFGRAALLGDAAHPMYPYGGNGAAQAILDAKALGAALAGAATPAEGLAAYEAERREKAYEVVLNNRRGGPERVIDAVENAVDGIVPDVDAILPFAEREAIVRGYSRIAGFAREQMAARR